MSVHPSVRPCDRIKLPLSPVTVPFFALYIHELSCVALNSSLRLCPAGTTSRKRARQTPLNSGSITAPPSYMGSITVKLIQSNLVLAHGARVLGFLFARSYSLAFIL